MAEFQQVMKQWRRMCDKNQTDCMRLCSICANPVCGELRNASNEDIHKAEDAIMAWAAEHPKPVYPTWYEFLTKRYHKAWEAVGCDSIPADIAEKLWIEPREG